jgi:exodeoxyribonuclease VII large subunit
VLFPASVQGEGAPPELIAALKAADECPGIEVILLVRGGGSLEDLWCFNDESLARALAEIERPVITGVGHEIDFTIADFIADRRAPTPSAAAELVAPDAAELRAGVDASAGRLLGVAQHALADAGEELARLFDRRVVRDVLGAVEQSGQEVDDAAQRLAELAATGVQLDEEEGLGELVARLADPLARRLADSEHLLPRLEGDLMHGARVGFERFVAEIGARERELTARDPRAPKKLGFALVWDKDGQLVRDAAEVNPGDKLRVEVREGEMDVERLPDA